MHTKKQVGNLALIESTGSAVAKKQPKKLIICVKNLGNIGREERLMADHAALLNIPIETASEKQMERGKVVVLPEYLVIGTVPFVHHALRHLGCSLPEHNPYPEVLKPWLHRKVYKVDSLLEVLRGLQNGEGKLFVKPADGWKKFTGFVVDDPKDYRFNGVSKRTAVWVSEPVSLVSEWRAYVLHSEIKAIKFADYGGDLQVRPNELEIEAAIKTILVFLLHEFLSHKLSECSRRKPKKSNF